MTSEVVQLSVQEWRNKARLGTLTVDEMCTALERMREERILSGAVSVKSTEKKASAAKKKAPIDSDDLLAQLSAI